MCKPVRGIVFAEVVANLAGQKVVVKLFEKVTTLLGVDGERGWVVFVQTPKQFSDRIFSGFVPSVEVPSKKVTFK